MKIRAILLCLVLSFDQIAMSAQTPAATSPEEPALNAPVPAQIAAAHTIFLSNGGADANFPVDASRVYNDIYKEIQSWGRYQMVGSPDQADLIFELRGVSTLTTYTGEHGVVYTNNNPSFQLTIVDGKSKVTLWTITSPVALAGSKQTLARWIAVSETNLISRIKVVSGQPLSAAETADLTTVPKNHFRRNALIITGAVVAAGALGGVLLYHEYQNGLASQKATQDAFCNANHIPLSECAGG